MNFLPEIKVSSLESGSDFLSYFRVLSTKKKSTMIQRDKRPYILAENISFEKDEVSFRKRVKVV